MLKNAADLVAFRENIGLTQAQLAARLGMHSRTYQELEAGKSKLRDVHALAIERIALDVALETGDPMKAPAEVRRLALDLARLITG